MKFGGSSVADAQMIRRVIEICVERLPDAPVLVASAMGDTTDVLVEIAESAEAGDSERASDLVAKLRAAHLQAVEELCTGETRDAAISAVSDLFSELASLAHGISLIRECSPRSRDAALSFGERLSTYIIAAAARCLDIPCTLIDARTLIRTDSSFTAAAPDTVATGKLVAQLLHPRKNHLVVTQGFIASNADGVTTTLGRGGSDFTATILGAALGVDSVEIWTDVDGIMSADPRVVSGARTIPSISYDEAAELAYFGARVVHPFTILPAVAQAIPVWVKNTRNPDSPGTRITGATEGAGVRAVASKSSITLITVRSSRMLNAYGFLRAIFAVFDKHRVSVDLVATSEVSVSMTVDSDVNLRPLERELRELGAVEIQREKSIVCLVGRELFRKPGVVADLLTAVEPANVRLVSFGASEINLSIVVDEAETHAVLNRLHDKLLAP